MSLDPASIIKALGVAHEYILYDGSRGEELVVTLRDATRSFRFTSGNVRRVPEPDCRDLLTSSIGGGAFHRCVSPAQAVGVLGVRKRDLPTPVVYRPRDGEPVELIALTPANIDAAARVRAGQQQKEVAE